MRGEGWAVVGVRASGECVRRFAVCVGANGILRDAWESLWVPGWVAGWAFGRLCGWG